MLEALVEHGIGATRAIVVDGNAVVEAHFERNDAGPLSGAVHVARLVKILEPGRRGIMRLGTAAQSDEGLIEPLPYCPEGGLLRVEVTRGAIHEAGRPRLAKLRNVEGDASQEGEVRAGARLQERLQATGHHITLVGGQVVDDRLEAAGWSELAETAQTGHLAFPGGLLTISPTPAMTVIDIDGPGDPVALAQAAAFAVGKAIRRFDITGSIGVDFPTLEGKAARTQIGDILDTILPAPFERTAVNGFGFVQIVRPRLRPSFIEQMRAPGFAALELLRRAARHGTGDLVLVGPPPPIVWLETRPALLAELGRTTGGSIGLRIEAGLGMAGAYVESAR